MNLKSVLIFVVGVLFLVILFQNTAVVTITFLFWKLTMSRILLVFFILLFGFSLGFLVGQRS